MTGYRLFLQPKLLFFCVKGVDTIPDLLRFAFVLNLLRLAKFLHFETTFVGFEFKTFFLKKIVKFDNL